jgi:hypothetical protein
MSLELRDLRTKVSVETDIALESAAEAAGQDKSEVARKVLHEWALQRLREFRIAHRLLRAEGINREAWGASGKERENTP